MTGTNEVECTEHINWVIDGTVHKCAKLPLPCPMCGKHSLAALPPPLLVQQPDETNVVCMPALGGCNQGFEVPLRYEW